MTTKNFKTAVAFCAVFENSSLTEYDFKKIKQTIIEYDGEFVEIDKTSIKACFKHFDASIETAIDIREFIIDQNLIVKIILCLKDVNSDDFIEKLVRKAHNNQILLSENIANLISENFKNKTVFVSKIIDKDNNSINIYTINHTIPNGKISAKLLLSYKKQDIILMGFADYIIGKDKDCDLILNKTKISDHHAVIIRKGNRFIIRDNSESGTYIKSSINNEIYINNEETALYDTGVISLGGSTNTNQKEIIKYKVIRS